MKRLLLFALLLPSLLARAPHSVGADATAFALLPAAQVDGSGIYLNQLLAENAAEPAPRARLANAPAFGQAVMFTRAQIQELLQKVAPELAAANFTGAQAVRVTRRVRTLEEVELKEQLTAALHREFVKGKGELELRLTRPWLATQVPDEPFTVKILEMPASGLTGYFIVRFELRCGKECVGAWQMPAQASLWQDVYVANSALARSQLLRAANLATERRDTLMLRDALTSIPDGEEQLELTEPLAAGMPVTQRAVRIRPAVRRGSLVQALITDGALNVTMKVEALEDGRLGQFIRLRNPQTRKEFFGKVQNEQTVLIPL
ncbi:MAG: flagellar basal body P-ring formation protein FlgA [Verrucomicrobia bacterium]|nr:flagellar basal body P-ring formation protein FlgA [Verrucomicrobiota bacterium]